MIINAGTARRPLLPLAWIGLGAANLVLFAITFALGLGSIATAWFRNPWALVSTHLFTLGFATPVVWGALYQLVPVLAETELRSVRLGWAHLVLHLPGFVLLICGFVHLLPSLMIAGGTLVALGATLLLINLGLTLRRAPRWHPALTYIVVALLYLALLLSLGLTLAFNFALGFFGAATRSHLIDHVIWGFGGWFTLTILGVAYKLVPLFTLTHREAGRLARPVLLLYNAGLWVALWWRLPGLLMLAGAVLLYLWEMAGLVRARVRRQLDISLRYGAHALLWLLVTGGLLLGLSLAPRVAPAWAAGALYALAMGWIGQMIIGHLFKIVPFLVWTSRYAERAGREPVPALADLYSQCLADWIRWLLSLGCLCVVSGLWLSWLPLAYTGAILSLLGVCAYGYSFLKLMGRMT
jgi:hypothetical protein